MVLMFQRELAERLAAAPGTAAYGRLSVIVQWLCAVRIALHLPGRAFVPPPQVSSSVVQLMPRTQPLAPADKPVLERVLAAAFGQRRKMLRVSLKSLTANPLALLEAAGVPPTARAEEIDVAGFCSLARSYAALDGTRRIRGASGTD
jgi:16S rRNA (adenine1518-N6/adenine1519-N6)-dimethyltransferase